MNSRLKNKADVILAFWMLLRQMMWKIQVWMGLNPDVFVSILCPFCFQHGLWILPLWRNVITITLLEVMTQCQRKHFLLTTAFVYYFSTKLKAFKVHLRVRMAKPGVADIESSHRSLLVATFLWNPFTASTLIPNVVQLILLLWLFHSPVKFLLVY